MVVGMAEEMDERMVMEMVVEKRERVARQGGRYGWLGATICSWRRKKK